MRILFVTQWFDPEPGALRGLPLARWLVARGHAVEVLTGFPNYPGGRLYPGYRLRPWQRQQLQGIPVIRVPLFPSHGSSALGRIVNYMSFAISAATIGAALVRPADVGFVYHPPPTVGLPGMVLKALRGIPFVYHIADMWPESVVESRLIRHRHLARIAEYTIRGWCARVYNAAAAITVLSPGFKRLLVARGVPASKVHVIYNWCDEEIFRPLPRDEQLAAELGMSGRFNVLYAGNLGTVQALETVVDAAALLQDLSNVQFVIIGTGQREAALRARVAQCRVTNVRFVEHRPVEEMPRINALAEVLLVHLKDSPVFAATIPSKTQVALAAARPVLMAVRGDAAELIQAAGAGCVCEPENPVALAAAVRGLFALPAAELDAMGRRGRRFYEERMSLSVGGAQMETLLRDVASRANGAAIPTLSGG